MKKLIFAAAAALVVAVAGNAAASDTRLVTDSATQNQSDRTGFAVRKTADDLAEQIKPVEENIRGMVRAADESRDMLLRKLLDGASTSAATTASSSVVQASNESGFLYKHTVSGSSAAPARRWC